MRPAILGLVLFVVAGACGKSSPGPTTPTSTEPAATTFNGIYTGTATTTDVEFCGMGQNQNFRGVLTVNSSGSGTWTLTQVDQAITFNPVNVIVSVNSAIATFSAPRTISFNGTGYMVNDTGSISGKTMSLTQSVRRMDGCSFTYKMTLAGA